MPMSQTFENPIARLLNSLPAKVADEKRQAIIKDLEPLGYVEHFRQTAMRPGFDIGKIYVRVADIIKQHLGVTDEFFFNLNAQQDQTKAIVKQAFNEVLESK